MKRRPLAFSLIVAAQLTLAGLSFGADDDVQTVVVAGQKDASEWLRVESPHFRVVSNAGRDAVARLVTNLERLDYVLRIYTEPYLKKNAGIHKIDLSYYAREGDLKRAFPDLPDEGIGLYRSCAGGVQGFGVNVEAPVEASGQELVKGPLGDSQSYLFEAYARHFLYRSTTIRAPASFVEGFAQYFSSVRFSETQMVVGRMPPSVARYLRFLDDGNRYSLTYADVLDGNLAGSTNVAGAAGNQLEFAARSWVLTHYMLSSVPNRQRMMRYLDLTAHGTPPARALDASFGLAPDALGSTMWRYGRSQVEVLQVDAPVLPRAGMTFVSLPRSTGLFVLADAVLRACPGRARGATVMQALERETPQFPDSAFAQLALSRARIDWGDPQAALPALAKISAHNDENVEAHALTGLANLRLAQRTDGAARAAYLDAAARSLARADALDPLAPDVTLALFTTDVLRGRAPDAQRRAAVSAAWAGAREVDALARAAFFAAVYDGDGEKAAAVLRVLTNNARSPQTAAWAAGWKQRLDAGVSTADLGPAVARDLRDDAPFDEWTIANANVMQRVEYNAGIEKAQRIIDMQVQNPDPSKALMSAPSKR
jgi:hypothetical protein